uniref:Uncharacterized protein n=1 Tax=Trichuris muris TaxID=70415 RepID=A0A5S6Q9U2_TRIMR
MQVPEGELVPDSSEERFSHVRVSFRLPVAAAYLLRSLQSNDPDKLRSLGVLSVEVDNGNDTQASPSCSSAAFSQEGRNEDAVRSNSNSMPPAMEYNGSGNIFSPGSDMRDAVGNCFRPAASADMKPSAPYLASAAPATTDGCRRMSADYQVLSPTDYQQMAARETLDCPLGQNPRYRPIAAPVEAAVSPWQCAPSTNTSPQPLRVMPKRVGRSPPTTVSANSPLLVGLLLQSSGSGIGQNNALVADGLNPTAGRPPNSSPSVIAKTQENMKNFAPMVTAALQKPKRPRTGGTRKGSEKRMRSRRDSASTAALRPIVDGIGFAKLANTNPQQVNLENETDFSSQYDSTPSYVNENSSFSFATKLHRETTINEVIQSVVLNAPGQDGFVEMTSPDNCDGQVCPLRIPDGGRTSKRLPSDPEDLNDCNLNPSSALSDVQSPQSVVSTDNRIPTDLMMDCLTPHVVPYSSAVSVPNSVSRTHPCAVGNAYVDAASAMEETDNAHVSPSGDLATLSAQVPEASFCNLRRSLSSKPVSPVTQALANGNDRRPEPAGSDAQVDYDSHSATYDLGELREGEEEENSANASMSSALQGCYQSSKIGRSNQPTEVALLASDYLVRTDHDYAPLFSDSLNHGSPQDRLEKPCSIPSDEPEDDCLIGKVALSAFEGSYDQDGRTLDVSVALLPQQMSSSQRQNHQWAMPTEMPFEQNVGSQ